MLHKPSSIGNMLYVTIFAICWLSLLQCPFKRIVNSLYVFHIIILNVYDRFTKCLLIVTLIISDAKINIILIKIIVIVWILIPMTFLNTHASLMQISWTEGKMPMHSKQFRNNHYATRSANRRNKAFSSNCFIKFATYHLVNDYMNKYEITVFWIKFIDLSWSATFK